MHLKTRLKCVVFTCTNRTGATGATPVSMASQTTARTQVTDRNTPPELLREKAKQLSQIGPAGWGTYLLCRVLSLPVCMATAVQMLGMYAKRLWVLLCKPDPSVFKLVPPFPLHEEYITVNGIKLHAVSPGRRPDKPLMLMLHGFPECWYSWRHQMAALADDWDVVALDMRGYNTSDKPQGVHNYRLHLLASDIKAAVAALGHKQCTLMAHDWGGVVAWVTAGLYGRNLVKELIVMGQPHYAVSLTNYTAKQYLKQTYILLFQARGFAELFLTADTGSVLVPGFLDPPMGVVNRGVLAAADVEWFRASLCQPGAATCMLNYYRALFEFVTISDPQDPAWSALKCQLDMPVLVLHGAGDGALGLELLDGIEAAAPQVSVKVLENCSHWVQQDYPQQVTELVVDWLKQQQEQEQGLRLE